jgi:futalosine hydrolase
MYLLVTATEMEAQPLRDKLPVSGDYEIFVAGVGPCETAVNLTRYLAEGKARVSAVFDFGVAGAYIDGGAKLLDLCLAQSEVVGDFGISFGSRVEAFAEPIGAPPVLKIDPLLVAEAEQVLARQQIDTVQGGFVTVNSVSGTVERGNLLRDSFNALCENMEGAAVARVCKEFSLPFLELRCVSNMVEDRNLANWQLDQAIDKCARAVSLLVQDVGL